MTEVLYIKHLGNLEGFFKRAFKRGTLLFSGLLGSLDGVLAMGVALDVLCRILLRSVRLKPMRQTPLAANYILLKIRN